MKAIAQGGFLVLVGCLQMAGDLAGLPALKAAGAISHASPAPKVFTAQQGFETYASRFRVTALPDGGAPETLALTPAVNRRLAGPYNRRNAYGAALSYGPVLAVSPRTRPMLESVLDYAFCGAGGLAAEIGLPAAPRYAVQVVPRERPADRPTSFFVDCTATSGVTMR